jgi:hypothetical protein
MKTKINLRNISLLFLLMFTISCTKIESELTIQDKQTNAIKQLKEIVGEQGLIKIINPSESKAIFTIDENSNQAKIKNLSLNEFKEVFKEIGTEIKYEAVRSTLVLDSSISPTSKIKSNSIKSFDDDDEDEGPGTAGYHHAQFGTGSILNKDKIGKYILHLFFNTNTSGQIVGTPTLFYTGIGFYSWQQMNMSSIIFNPSNYSSNFIITGVNTYGVQIDGLTIGWSSYANFNIKISMDELGRYEVVVIEKK